MTELKLRGQAGGMRLDTIPSMSLWIAGLLAALLPVPFVPQQKDTCAAASLAMVMSYWQAPASHDEIAAALLSPELRGIAGSKLRDFARERGFQAIAYAGDAANLRDYVEKGRPLIVAWKMSRGRYHDVVVLGFEGDAVVVNDPDVGPSRAVPWKTFEKRWAGAGPWTLLVLPEPR
jgi:ABC-type bacteriocin/lantibiotic exporter with double-glycine peptidase domain